MSWINVLWQDPEEGQVYDVWTEDGERKLELIWLKGEWRNSETMSVEDTSKVTHFMPSPEPPKD